MKFVIFFNRTVLGFLLLLTVIAEMLIVMIGSVATYFGMWIETKKRPINGIAAIWQFQIVTVNEMITDAYKEKFPGYEDVIKY